MTRSSLRTLPVGARFVGWDEGTFRVVQAADGDDRVLVCRDALSDDESCARVAAASNPMRLDPAVDGAGFMGGVWDVEVLP